MTNTRTIDNLGSDVSVSYAIAKERGLQEPDLSIDPSPFKAIAEITVTSPYIISDFDNLFNMTGKKACWAGFSAPDNFEGNRKTKLFSFQLIPSIGTIEHQEAIKEKILHFKAKRKRQQSRQQEKEGEQEMESQQDQKEHQKILDLIDEFLHMDKIHINILAKRGEYQRG